MAETTLEHARTVVALLATMQFDDRDQRTLIFRDHRNDRGEVDYVPVMLAAARLVAAVVPEELAGVFADQLEAHERQVFEWAYYDGTELAGVHLARPFGMQVVVEILGAFVGCLWRMIEDQAQDFGVSSDDHMRAFALAVNRGELP